MTPKLVRWSLILALPVSAALAAPAERAVEVPLNSTKTTVSKPKSHEATPVVKERTLSMRDTSPAGPDENGVYHSIHDWVPRTPTKASEAQAQSEEANHAHRTHWWSRPHQVASGQKAEEVKPN
jgi:hypothetical protein